MPENSNTKKFNVEIVFYSPDLLGWICSGGNRLEALFVLQHLLGRIAYQILMQRWPLVSKQVVLRCHQSAPSLCLFLQTRKQNQRRVDLSQLLQ